MELDTLASFLDRVEAVGSGEISRRELEVRATDDYDIDDISNAVMEPLEWIDLAVRAVYHELAALIEHELQNAAHPAWLAERAPSRPPLAPGPSISAEFRQWLKTEVTDVRFDKLVRARRALL